MSNSPAIRAGQNAGRSELKATVPLDEATFWRRHYDWLQARLLEAEAVVRGLRKEEAIAVERLGEIGCPNPKALCVCGHRAEVHLTEYGIDRGCFILLCPCERFQEPRLALDAVEGKPHA